MKPYLESEEMAIVLSCFFFIEKDLNLGIFFKCKIYS